jgi:alkyldihydroxyacetonephosphate synthase
MRKTENWWSDAWSRFGPLISRDPLTLRQYAGDAWPLQAKRRRAGDVLSPPAAVFLPRGTDDVAVMVNWARNHDVALVARGAGSSVTGAAIPGEGTIVVDVSSMNRIVGFDSKSGHVHVECGVLGGALEEYLSERDRTTWFSPQSLLRSTVGGWIATAATGQFSTRFGDISDLVSQMTVVLASGEIVRLGNSPRGAVGPDLANLIIGSEGAFGIVTEAWLRTYPAEPLTGLVTYGLPSVEAGLNAVREIMQSGVRPALVRLYDADEASTLAVPQPPPPAVLLLGFVGPHEIAAAEKRSVQLVLEAAHGADLGAEAVAQWMAGRYDFSAIESLLDSEGGYAETIEVAGTWAQISVIYFSMKDALRPIVDQVFGHFSHAYSDGISLYLIVRGNVGDDRDAVKILERVWDSAMETALETGAVISHHHGIGRVRAAYLERYLGAGAMGLLTTLKRGFDPTTLFHPGSLVTAANEDLP